MYRDKGLTAGQSFIIRTIALVREEFGSCIVQNFGN